MVLSSPRSRSFDTVIFDLDDWEKLIEKFEKFELCGGTISDRDKRIVPLKKLPPSVHRSLVSTPPKCHYYATMKLELHSEIIFLMKATDDTLKL